MQCGNYSEVPMPTDELRMWERDCRCELMLDHENEIFLKFVLLANILGYRYVTYGLELPTSVPQPSFSYYNNFADGWMEKFVVRNAKHHGSRVAYGKRTIDGSNPVYYWQRPDFFSEAGANSISLQWMETIQGKAGSVALVGLGGLTESRSIGFNQRTRVLIDLVVEAMEGVLVKKHLPQYFIALNEEERTYMMWVLDGKTAIEIAAIMGISQSIADRMQRQLPVKFDKKGIFATAFLAYRLGMLNQFDTPAATSG